MIEKIMKAVKSGSKKRGRNITIGADEYLWIKNDSGTIKFSTDNNNPTGIDNPYIENNWDGSIYINNITLSGTDNDSGTKGYGLKLEGDLGEFKLINNGSIAGIATGSNVGGYGIYNAGTIKELVNNGSIAGTATEDNSDSSGIYNFDTMKALTNMGLIKGTSEKKDGRGYLTVAHTENLVNSGLIIGTSAGNTGEGSGIYNVNDIEAIANSGSITGISTGDTGEGLGIWNGNKISTLTNIGLIKGISTESNGKGYGILNESTLEVLSNTGLITGIAVENSNESYGVSTSNTTTLTNKGVIYGKTHAVENTGTITSFNNYGLLISETDDTVNGATPTNEGLIFKEVSEGKYTAKTDDDYNKFGKKYDSSSSGYIIINAKAEGENKDNITGTKSLTLEEGKLTYYDSKETSYKEESISLDKKYILNGITDTLKVIGGESKLNNSIINAYETAVAMNGMSMLTLNNTTVNGGVKDSTVNIGGDGNTLTIQGDSIINSSDKAIIVVGNNNDVTLEGNTVVNGKMESTGNNNIINLHGKNMSILHDISGFENMNIKNNVTFFEDVNIKGLKEIKVGETGVLNLRLENTGRTADVEGSLIPKAKHALLGNDMIIQGEGNGVDTAGTLNFVTNGIGKKIYVDMTNIELKNLYIKTSSVIDGYKIKEKEYALIGVKDNLDEIYRPEDTRGSSLTEERYESLNNIYKGIYSSTDENLNALRALISFNNFGNNYEENMSDDEQLKNLMSYLNSIYAETPYSFSSELSRKSTGMFRDIVTENHFRPDLNKWMIMGGLTHADGGTKDTYYGQNYHGFDGGTANTDVDMKLTGAYALGKYGYSENVSLGVTVGGNKSEAELSMSKVEGSSGYIGAFVENYRGNLTLKAGGGIQYSEYDADRRTLGGYSYNEKYSDMAYDIYLNGRYSHNIGDNLFLEPYTTLSYTYIDQDGADEGNQTLVIETDSKSFDYTVGKIGVDLKKVIPHEKGKSTLSAGVSYTRILDGADEEFITGRFKGGSDFDILVAHKNEHSIGLNAKYALELENGVLFDVKGTYAVERDSHNEAGKNKTKGEWIIGAGLGYKF